jgi:hypothetical protein
MKSRTKFHSRGSDVCKPWVFNQREQSVTQRSVFFKVEAHEAKMLPYEHQVRI